MAELLIRVVDKTHADPMKDVKLTKRGDVICVQEDNWPWSEAEKTNPDWRIFKWPSSTVSALNVFLTPELSTEPKTSEDMPDDPMLQIRGFSLDVDLAGLPKALRDFVADNTRAQPFFTVPASVTVAAVKRQKAKRANPAVIG